VRENFLLIEMPFALTPPESNDRGGHEGTEIGRILKYAQPDDEDSIRGNEGSERVENISVHDTSSAYVDSFELCATPDLSRLDSRRHDTIERTSLDNRHALSIDTAANYLHEDEIFIEMTFRDL
jgi:hypothetical protein